MYGEIDYNVSCKLLKNRLISTIVFATVERFDIKIIMCIEKHGYLENSEKILKKLQDC